MAHKKTENQRIQQLTRQLSELLDPHHLAVHGSDEDLFALLDVNPVQVREVLETAYEQDKKAGTKTVKELERLYRLACCCDYKTLLEELHKEPQIMKDAIQTSYDHFRGEILALTKTRWGG